MDENLKDTEMVSVYRAQDEVTAHLVKGILEEAGMEVAVISQQVPWYDGVMTNAQGYWGDVMAPAKDSEQCATLIQDFQSAALNDDADDAGEEPEPDIE